MAASTEISPEQSTSIDLRNSIVSSSNLAQTGGLTSTAVIQDDQTDDTMRFVRLEAFGISANDYAITCKSMPRATLMASNLDDYLAGHDPVALADSLMPPPAQADSKAPLGKYSELKLAVICVGVAPLHCFACTCIQQCGHLHGI